MASVVSEYSGSDGVLRVDGQTLLFGFIEIEIFGETGNVSASEYKGVRRKGTLQDWRCRITQMSMTPENNPFAPPLNMTLFSSHDVVYYPGGTDNEPYILPGGIVKSGGLRGDVNNMQPVDVELVAASGELATFPEQNE